VIEKTHTVEKVKVDFAAEKVCANCKFYDTILNPAGAIAMHVCRQKSPTAQGQCIGVDPQTRQPQWIYTTLWPMVASTDWCADFARKLQS
jgi:hypothetical protein